MRGKSLTYLIVAVFLAWAVATPAFGGGTPLSEQEMEAIQAGTVITSNTIETDGDALNNVQNALWQEFSNVFLGNSAQQNLQAVNNVMAADSQVGVQSNIVTVSSEIGDSNTITQANFIGVEADEIPGIESTITVFNLISAGGSAAEDPEDGNTQFALYNLEHFLRIEDVAQQELKAVNNVVAAGSQVGAQSNIVGVGTEVGSLNIVSQSNEANVSRDVFTGNILSAGDEARGNTQTALWFERSFFLDIDQIDETTVENLGLGDQAQQNLQAVNNVVAVDSQVAAQSNVMSVGSSIGNTNTIDQSNKANVTSVIDVINLHESGTVTFAPGIIGDDGDSDNLLQVAEYILFHDATMRDQAQQNLQAINNVVASGSQVAAQSNVLTIGSSTGDFNDVTQSNDALVSRSATTLNLNLNGDDAAAPGSIGNTVMVAEWIEAVEEDLIYLPGITVNLLNDAQQHLQAINNVVAAGSQVAAQSNIVGACALGGSCGTNGGNNGPPTGETDNDIAQSNSATVASNIIVGNFVEAGIKTLADGQLDQHGYALGLEMFAEYYLVHTVFLTDNAQEFLQAVNNVVAAGSQVAAQSNVIAIGQSTGAQDDLSQDNSATVTRLAVTRNDIIAPGEPNNNINNEMEATWVEKSFVEMNLNAQRELQAINNVVAADSQVASQSNVITVGTNFASNSTVSQSNDAFVASLIDVGNSIDPGIPLDQATADANNNRQFARYFLFHQVNMNDQAQRDLQAVNNVVAAGSQVAAQSNLMTVGGQVGSTNTISQDNSAVVARAAFTTNAISAGGSANNNNQGLTDPNVHCWQCDEDPAGASWVEHSFIFMNDDAQRNLRAINNVVAADSQVASQSNLIAFGQTTGSSNTMNQTNAALIDSAIDVGNSIDAGRSTVTWEQLQALGVPLFPGEENNTGFVAEDTTANNNSQRARYILVHNLDLSNNAQRDLEAVNNVVASGSQVAAQSNIATIGGTVKSATVTPSPSLSLELGTRVSVDPRFTVTTFDVPTADPPIVTADGGVTASSFFDVLVGLDLEVKFNTEDSAGGVPLDPNASLGSSNTAGQLNVALVSRSADTTNSIKAGSEADENSQNAFWLENSEADIDDAAQRSVDAINNVVAADSQVAAQSNLVAIGGSVGSSNAVSQVNDAVVTSVVNVASSIEAGTNPVRNDDSSADGNDQSASYILNHKVDMDDDAQETLQAINNVVSAGSQAAAQSNIVAVGSSIADDNHITQLNFAGAIIPTEEGFVAIPGILRVANTTTSASSTGLIASTSGNTQSAFWFEDSEVEMDEDAQKFLEAVNNMVLADSQAAAQSNIVAMGSDLGSTNTITQGNVAVVASVIDVENSASAVGIIADADFNSQFAEYSLNHRLDLDDESQENLKAINNVVAAGSQAAAQSNIVAVGNTVGSNNTITQFNVAVVARSAVTENTVSAVGIIAVADFNDQTALWFESSKIDEFDDDVQKDLQAINNMVLADSQAAAQSNIVTIGSSLGSTNTITQDNFAAVLSDIDVGNTVEAVGLLAFADFNSQFAEYSLNHRLDLDDETQEFLQAVNNVLAAGSQVAAQSNIVTVGDEIGNNNTINQANAAIVARAADTTNEISAIGLLASASFNSQTAEWFESSEIDMEEEHQEDLQAINNVLAADAQVAAQSNIVTIGGGIGNNTTITQANAAIVDSDVDVGNSIVSSGSASFNSQFAEYSLSHDVDLDNETQQFLQAVNNVVAAGSQVAAQSNIVAVGGGIGNTNTISQLNAAEVARHEDTFNTIEAGGSASFNRQEALWFETSHVDIDDDAQRFLQAVNNVVGADAHVAAQSNIVTIGSGIGNNNTITQANAAIVTSDINTFNSISGSGTNFNFQLATYVLGHSVFMEDNAQQDLHAVNNVVAAGSQVAAQSNIVTVGDEIGNTNTISQANAAIVARVATTTNSIKSSGLGSASFNHQEAFWFEGSGVTLTDFAQQNLQAVNNVVAAGAQVAAQSNIVAIGGGIGNTNTIDQLNAAIVTSDVLVGNSIIAGGDADFNFQFAQYFLEHGVFMNENAQQNLQAVNNVVAAGSQVAAQSNIVTIGGGIGDDNVIGQVNAAIAARREDTFNTIEAGGSASFNSQQADWFEFSGVFLTDFAQQNLRAVNNVVVADSQAAAQSNIVAIGGGIGNNNTIGQLNVAAALSDINTFNSISAGGNADFNTQIANYVLNHSVSLNLNAQQNLQAVNNVVAAGSQVAAQSNIVTVGSGIDDTNTALQSNVAALERKATTTNSIEAEEGSASFNNQDALWTEFGSVILWDEAQQNLQAINNVVAADSQVAAQSNLASVGSGIGDDNSLTQVNVIAIENEIDVSNSILAGGSANNNDQLASYFLTHTVSLTGNAQQFLKAINNVVAAGSQVGASSNIAAIGSGVGNTNNISQTSVMSISR